MARFEVLYYNTRRDLDRVIEADTYTVSTKFFTFLKNKEVIRVLKTDIVVQIKRLDDGENGNDDDDDEGDITGTVDSALDRLTTQNADQLAEVLASLPGDEELAEVLASLPGDEELAEVLASLPGDEELAEVLASLPGDEELAEVLASLPGDEELAKILKT